MHQVAVDFGRPLADVVALRVHWRGISALGTALCDGHGPGPWPIELISSAAIDQPGRPYSFLSLPDGAFDSDQPFVCPNGYGFLSSGICELRFQLIDGPLDCGDNFTVITPPQCALDYVAVTIVTAVPNASATWGAVKSLYGR
jgi:hypothetical protein